MAGQVRRDDVEPRPQRGYERQKVLELRAEGVKQHDRRPRPGAHVSEITITEPRHSFNDAGGVSSVHGLIARTSCIHAARVRGCFGSREPVPPCMALYVLAQNQVDVTADLLLFSRL
jgi:hypothetical protein